MRTSATGRADLRANRGFTLVELLIVLTVVGLMSAAVVIAMPDSRGSLRAEAERFAARAKSAQDKAVIEARPMAVRVTSDGYGFETRRGKEWQPLEREPLGPHQWSEGTRALVGEEGARFIFDSTGIAEPATLPLERDGEQATVAIGHDGRIAVDG